MSNRDTLRDYVQDAIAAVKMAHMTASFDLQDDRLTEDLATVENMLGDIQGCL